MGAPPPRDGERGFTLLELVIVVGIFGLVMSMAYQILSTTIEAERRVNRDTRTGKIGEGILTQIRRDLQGLVWRSYGPQVFRGVDAGQGENAEDEFHFLTTSPVPEPSDGSDWLGAVAAVGYVLKAADDGNHILYRRVKWELGDNPLEDGKYYEIYGRVRALDIHYLDREGEWLDEWDRAVDLEALENQNWNTFLPFRDQDAFDQAQANANDPGDPTAPSDPDDPDEGEEEEDLPLPVPRAVEIILRIAVGDERGNFLDPEGNVLVEEVSTIVPILCSEILRIEDPAQADPAD